VAFLKLVHKAHFGARTKLRWFEKFCITFIFIMNKPCKVWKGPLPLCFLMFFFFQKALGSKSHYLLIFFPSHRNEEKEIHYLISAKPFR
jgi:hypothetical protein